jgi:hypothetical protein
LSLPIFGGYPFIFFKLVNQFNPLARELIFGRCAFAAFENTLTRLLNRLCRILFLHRHRPFQNSVCDTACSILLQGSVPFRQHDTGEALCYPLNAIFLNFLRMFFLVWPGRKK